MLRRRIQVHLQRLFSMDFDGAAPSCSPARCCASHPWVAAMPLVPDPPAAMRPSLVRTAPLPRRRRATLATMQLRDVIDG